MISLGGFGTLTNENKTWFPKLGPWIWIVALVLVLFLLSLFLGSKRYEFTALQSLGSYLMDSTNLGANYTDYEYSLSDEDFTDSEYSSDDDCHYIESQSHNISDSTDTSQSAASVFSKLSVPRQMEIPASTKKANFQPIATFEPSHSARVSNMPLPPLACPTIQPKKKLVAESICRKTMEDIYGVPFASARPEFLKNPETNYNLELDCYNEELGLAVEYNGIQHYEYPNCFHKTEEEFVKQLRRDLLKVQLCDINGVYLITVPYDVKPNNIPNYLRERLPPHIPPPQITRINRK